MSTASSVSNSINILPYFLCTDIFQNKKNSYFSDVANIIINDSLAIHYMVLVLYWRRHLITTPGHISSTLPGLLDSQSEIEDTCVYTYISAYIGLQQKVLHFQTDPNEENVYVSQKVILCPLFCITLYNLRLLVFSLNILITCLLKKRISKNPKKIEIQILPFLHWMIFTTWSIHPNILMLYNRTA